MPDYLFLCTAIYIKYMSCHLIELEKLGCGVLNTAMLGTKVEPRAMPSESKYRWKEQGNRHNNLMYNY